MLLKATHSASSRRLPSDLLGLYVRYKQGTRAIITWLVQHSSWKCSTTITIRDLVELCDVVCAKPILMPEIIDFYFRDTIAARRRLTKFFQLDDCSQLEEATTINHDYFTTCLTKMYMGLCECCSKPRKECIQAKNSPSAPPTDKYKSNRFTWLCETSISDNDVDKPEPVTVQRRSCSITVAPAIASHKNSPRLVDDQLGDACELCKNLEQMNGLVFATNEVWGKAARHECSIIVAAHVTNAAFAAFQEIEQNLQTHCGILNPEDLQRKSLQLQDIHSGPKDSTIDAVSGPWQLSESLQTPWSVLLQYKAHYHPRQTSQSSHETRPPSQAILRRGEDAESKDQDCIAMILKDVENHISMARQSASVVRLGSPLYTEFEDFLTYDEANAKGVRCCFGLHVFLKSYRSYIFAAHPPGACPNCRLQALRFAQEAVLHIKAILDDATMPCRCYNTLAYHLQNVQEELDKFLRERAFDLYFQSPWVSGSHMLEMLETCFYYGLRLMSYRLYVPSVCHVYNALRRCTSSESILLLEELCNTFRDILFPGGIPKKNFKAAFIRFKGGRLHFDPHSSDHKSGNHHMVVPAHTAKATAGFGSHKEVKDPRFEYRKISLFHHIKEKGYHLDNDLWTRVFDLADADETQASEIHLKHATSSRHRRTSSRHATDSEHHRLLRLEKAVLREFTGPFPVAKVNLFEVYLACERIVGIISDKMHGDLHHGIHCLCFADVLLTAADGYEDNSHKLQPFGCKELVKTCQDAMQEVLGHGELEAFLWKNI